MVSSNPAVFNLLTLGGELVGKLASTKRPVIGSIFAYYDALIVGPIFEMLFGLNSFSGGETYLMTYVEKTGRVIYKNTSPFVGRRGVGVTARCVQATRNTGFEVINRYP
jgi:hypothetical protein